MVFYLTAVVHLLYICNLHNMVFGFPGLYELISLLIVAGIVYYISTAIPSPFAKQVGSIVSGIIAVIALLTFLRHYIA